MENLNFYEPDEHQLHKFRVINSRSAEDHDLSCVHYDDCSICPMAIHQHLLTVTRHTCVYGMSESEFLVRMQDADCNF